MEKLLHKLHYIETQIACTFERSPKHAIENGLRARHTYHPC